MRALIVGGAGFVAGHLAERLLADGHQVDALVRPQTDTVRLSRTLPQVRQHRADPQDRAALAACLALARPTHIFYLAGHTASRHDPAVAQARTSIAGVADLLAMVEATAAVPQPPCMFLRTGSIAEYGSAATPFAEAQREQPETAYAAGIVAGTHYAAALAPRLPFPIVTVRLGLVYGPDQRRDFLVPSLVFACLERQPMTLHRPLDRRDLVHVDDVVEGLLRIVAASPAGGTILNMGGSAGTIGVAQLAARIAMLSGSDPDLFRHSDQSNPVTLQLDNRRLTRMTGWRPEIPLDEGLRMLVAATRHRLAAAA